MDNWNGTPYLDEPSTWALTEPDYQCQACQQNQYRHSPGCPIDDIHEEHRDEYYGAESRPAGPRG